MPGAPSRRIARRGPRGTADALPVSFGITYEQGATGTSAHNTAVDNQGIGINAVSGARPVVEDNVVVGHRGQEWSAGIDWTPAEGDGQPTLGRNLLWDNTRDLAAGLPEVGLVRDDPRFRDREGGDYRPRSSSPARRAASDGRDLGAPPEALRLDRVRAAMPEGAEEEAPPP